MPFDVALLVLLGALFHASWNAIIKGGEDKVLNTAMISLGGAVISLCALPFFPMPGWQIWPFLMASVVLQTVYFLLIAASYRLGDIALVYPLMRGSAPLVVTALSFTIFGERISTHALIGIGCISGGIFIMALGVRANSLKAAGLALINAVVIGLYTLFDAWGARTANNPISYVLWISLLPPVALFAYALYTRGRVRVGEHLRTNWWRGAVGGAGSIGSYGVALWAMTKAPVALVAALRETSIVFALLISVFVFRENGSVWRYLAGGVITAGALALKLA
ncbi:EamA-like transporter family protein [Ensifer adhaerens]|nr:EamA-like transporter family protein [Ensifer adhaerens]